MMTLRAWATPLVIGAFLVMAASGSLMFFHLDTATMKLFHEWAGLVMVVGGIAHLILNWRAFTCYLKRPLASGIMALGVVVLGLTLVPNLIPGVVAGAGLGPKVVMEAMGNARIATLAELSGKPVEALLADLGAAGFTNIDPAATVMATAAGDGGKMRSILAVALVPKP